MERLRMNNDLGTPHQPPWTGKLCGVRPRSCRAPPSGFLLAEPTSSIREVDPENSRARTGTNEQQPLNRFVAFNQESANSTLVTIAFFHDRHRIEADPQFKPGVVPFSLAPTCFSPVRERCIPGNLFTCRHAAA
jgi:hypothetical protein